MRIRRAEGGKIHSRSWVYIANVADIKSVSVSFSVVRTPYSPARRVFWMRGSNGHCGVTGFMCFYDKSLTKAEVKRLREALRERFFLLAG